MLLSRSPNYPLTTDSSLWIDLIQSLTITTHVQRLGSKPAPSNSAVLTRPSLGNATRELPLLSQRFPNDVSKEHFIGQMQFCCWDNPIHGVCQRNSLWISWCFHWWLLSSGKIKRADRSHIPREQQHCHLSILRDTLCNVNKASLVIAWQTAFLYKIYDCISYILKKKNLPCLEKPYGIIWPPLLTASTTPAPTACSFHCHHSGLAASLQPCLCTAIPSAWNALPVDSHRAQTLVS